VEGGKAAAGHFGFGPGSKFLFSKSIGALAPMLTIAQIADFAFDDDDIKAVVEGNATLDANITVKTEPGFWAQIDQKINNAINAFRSSNAPATGTAGSTGRSMPEAVAGP
jgi:hypothetical protein